MTKRRSIFLDYLSTTPLLQEVWQSMEKVVFSSNANPSSSHAWGREARKYLEEAREQVATLLQARPTEIIFTSGATEANNLAVFGLSSVEFPHIVSSEFEHPCVIEPIRSLEKMDYKVDWIKVQNNGIVDVHQMMNSIKADTGLLTLMLVNHETGAIQPVQEVVSKAKVKSLELYSSTISSSSKTPFRAPLQVHCDASQAVGKIFVSFRELGVDTLSISAHKFNGPKGIGVLVLREGEKLTPLFRGGFQQQGKRPGTEPVFLAVGLATALRLAIEQMEVRLEKVKALRNRFIDNLSRSKIKFVFNTDFDVSIPYVVNVSFPPISAALLLMKFDLVQIFCSAGSACASGSLLPSPVLRSMNLPKELIQSALRFGFSPDLTIEDIDYTTSELIKIIQQLTNCEDRKS